MNFFSNFFISLADSFRNDIALDDFLFIFKLAYRLVYNKVNKLLYFCICNKLSLLNLFSLDDFWFVYMFLRNQKLKLRCSKIHYSNSKQKKLKFDLI